MNQGKSDAVGELRLKAEARLQGKARQTSAPQVVQDMPRLLHELQVHQIELEMQNASLHEAQAEIESGRRFTDLYEFAPVGYFSLAGDGSIRLLNLAAASLLGLERSQLIGRQLTDFVAPGSRSAFSALLARVYATGNRECCEIGVLSLPEAASLDVHIDAVADRTGGVCNLAITDVSGLKQAEQQLREGEEKFRLQSQRLAELIWATNSGTWEVNLQTGEVSFNARWAEILGYGIDEITPLRIEYLRQFAHPEDLIRSDALLDECFSHRSEDYACELRLRHKHGHWVWVVSRGRVVEWTPDGQPLRMSGTNQDITDRKAVEADLLVAKAEAERANNAKSRFLAAASHDLRQPLSALGLYVGVLKSRAAPGDAVILSNMASCVSSLNELLTDLLDISKFDAGVVKPEVMDFSVAELLANLISMHTPEAQLKGLSLRWLAAELTARTDPVLYKRLLGNLIANAIRYTERGGVLVACRRQHGKTWVEVWDTGVGIPEDKTSEIFEEFRQLGHDERNRGSGLGLAIVAKSAALLGLQIRVRSRLGKGSMFAVELPLGRASRKVVPRKVKLRPLRIALVEDNAGVLNALVCALEVVGHRVVAASTGPELLGMLGKTAPDIVISDFRLAGGKNGFEVIGSVREAFGTNLPALLITGDTDPKLMRSMADRGIVVQHKPVDIDSLQLCIAQATSWRR